MKVENVTWSVCDCGECEGCRARQCDDLRAQVRKLTDDVDGARRVAIVAERERDEAREKSARRGVLLWQAEQERDRLLAALATTPENIAAVSVMVDRWYSKNPPWTEPEKAASAIVAAIRAKAGLP